MRISDWSSDVCSSDLQLKDIQAQTPPTQKRWNFESNDFASTPPVNNQCPVGTIAVYRAYNAAFSRGKDSTHRITSNRDRKRVVWGKSVAVREDIGGRRISKTKTKQKSRKKKIN